MAKYQCCGRETDYRMLTDDPLRWLYSVPPTIDAL